MNDQEPDREKDSDSEPFEVSEPAVERRQPVVQVNRPVVRRKDALIAFSVMLFFIVIGFFQISEITDKMEGQAQDSLDAICQNSRETRNSMRGILELAILSENNRGDPSETMEQRQERFRQLRNEIPEVVCDDITE